METTTIAGKKNKKFSRQVKEESVEAIGTISFTLKKLSMIH